MIVLRRLYHCESSHQLTAGVPEGHKCRRHHGHRYEVELAITGPVHPDGMIVEYGVLDAAISPVIEAVDHHDLNTLGLRWVGSDEQGRALATLTGSNPTVENLIRWMVYEASIAVASIPERACKLVGVRIREDAAALVEWLDVSPPRGQRGLP